MKERKKPTKSFIARSVEEIEKEALKVGYEAGFTKACEILHDFALLVRKMRKAQVEERCTRGTILEDKKHMERHLRLLNKRENYEESVDTWIQENYENFEED